MALNLLRNKKYISMRKLFIATASLFTIVLAMQGYSCKENPVLFIEEEVRFTNTLDGTTFAGTFTKPAKDGIYPAAILITGGGPQDRDETLYGHKPFKVLAEHLSRSGIAVLRFDDRGIGGSGKGDLWNADLRVLTNDVYAAVQFLKSRKDVDPDKIGLIGHSLGAMQGTILASMHDDIAYLVMLGGIGISWSDNHVRSDSLVNKRKGKSDEVVSAGTALLRSILEVTKTARDYDSTRTVLFDRIQDWQASLTGETATEINEFTASNPKFWEETIADEYATPIYLSLARYDPYPYLRRIQCPVLSIIGDKDVQVVPVNNAAIENALLAGGNNNYTIHIPNNINHMMQHCETGLISEYAEIDEDFNQEILTLITNWITANVEDK